MVQLGELFDDPLAAWPATCVTATEVREAALPHLGAIIQLSKEASEHRFDLLGSGLVRTDYSLEAKGMEGFCHHMAPGQDAEASHRLNILALLQGATEFTGEQTESDRRIMGALTSKQTRGLDDLYLPIDWHVDFKSGYRWNPGDWYLNVPYGHEPGVDIKVPWELSRFQHTAWMGLSSSLAETNGEQSGWADIGQEWVLQVLDWIASNPVRYGVNWRSTMDVAIRSANWIWGLSLFQDNPALSPSVRWLILTSLYRHALHIENNLEYYPEAPTTNHYLADIVGLLHIAAAVPQFPESDRWLAFCLQELIGEMGRTVYPDGASYEASTHYHRLVCEMFLHATLLALRLPQQRRTRIKEYDWKSHRVKPSLNPYVKQLFDSDRPEIFPDWFLVRLERMVEFTHDLTKPNGRIPTLGDHDDGRLVKLAPVVQWDDDGGRFREEFRDHRHLVAIGGVLFDRNDFQELGASYRLEAEVLTQGIPHGVLDAVRDATQGYSVDRTREPKPLQAGQNAYLPRIAGPQAHEKGYAVYPDIGITVYRRNNFWLAITCGLTGVHGHIDQLSLELCIEGQDVVVDPGSYVYTPLPVWRNLLRSARSHSTWYSQELDQLTLGEGLFEMRNNGCARVLRSDPDCWVGEWRFDATNLTMTRSIRFEDEPPSIDAERKVETQRACESMSWIIRASETTVRVQDLLVGDLPEEMCWQLCLTPHCNWEMGEEKGKVYFRNSSTEIEIETTRSLKVEPCYYSPGYGTRVKSHVIRGYNPGQVVRGVEI